MGWGGVGGGGVVETPHTPRLDAWHGCVLWLVGRLVRGAPFFQVWSGAHGDKSAHGSSFPSCWLALGILAGLYCIIASSSFFLFLAVGIVEQQARACFVT